MGFSLLLSNEILNNSKMYVSLAENPVTQIKA